LGFTVPPAQILRVLYTQKIGAGQGGLLVTYFFLDVGQINFDLF
jgi:hypothetical protein